MSKFVKISCEITDEETGRSVTAEISGNLEQESRALQVRRGEMTPDELEGLNLVIDGYKRMFSPPGESR